MKLSGRTLQKRDLYPVIMFRGNESLDRIDGRVEVRLARRDHANYRPQNGNFGRGKAHFSHFCDVSGGLMIFEDAAKFRLNFRTPIHLAAIKPDNGCIIGKKCSEIVGIGVELLGLDYELAVDRCAGRIPLGR